MTDEEIVALAKQLGWNVEHAQTNRMLVLFAREIFSKERALFDAALLNSHPTKVMAVPALLESAGWVRKREPLTDEQIMEILDYGRYGSVPAYQRNFVRAIERAHGIGEQT